MPLQIQAAFLALAVSLSKGIYRLDLKDPAWAFSGSIPSQASQAQQDQGQDALGSYRQISFHWHSQKIPMSGWIRIYQDQPLALFSQTCEAASEMPPGPFPDFSALPPNLHVFSHRLDTFAPPQFAANENGTPWLCFNDQAEALIISPATHFMVASMWGDGKTRMASGFNASLRHLPKGYTQQTLLTFGKGINQTYEAWGQALLSLEGAKRPANDADATLKYLGYWTDNGATYYYNYDLKKGYTGTLQGLVEQYRKEQIPLRYLQLDSWWYSKSLTGPDGELGHTKNAALPEGEWNRYGGTLEYRAHPYLFPNGLDAFQKSVGLPFVTHNRWIDVASPDRQKYAISGLGAQDPKWWQDTAAYLRANGVETYEQDWLDRIVKYSPTFSSTTDSAEAFLGNMAAGLAAQGISMQYCMPYACHILQGSLYPNLTSIRTSDDRFGIGLWNNFLYTSRLASALRIWPWADVYNSTEINNLLLSTLSAGPVGIGDALGTESKANLLQAVRTDGVIVKPDLPITPMDRCYVADARGDSMPLQAQTCTQHGSIKTAYVFAFNRPGTGAAPVQFSAAELGLTGTATIYDFFAGTSQRVDSSALFSAPLAKETAAYYVVVAPGPSGIALLGDAGKFVGTGKQRVSAMQEEAGKLEADLVFAENEDGCTVHGFANAKPAVSSDSGKLGRLHYDSKTGYFKLKVSINPASPLDTSGADPIRHLKLSFSI